MMNRIKAPVVTLVAVLALSGCDLLDVNNPNNLVEESIRTRAAASAVVNGSEALVSSAVSQMWQPYLVAADEMYWIGSRDAWLSLDQGFVEDPFNEFTDGAFPSMGQARWMADEAVEILTELSAEFPELSGELARANLYAGIIYMVIGEVMEDFALSDKTQDGAPIGPMNMSQMFTTAISRLDAAISGGSSDIKMAATAMRARARHSAAVWAQINPVGTTPAFVSSQAAVDDALATIGMAGGIAADWTWGFTYSAGTVTNSMASWVNDRKENQIDLSIVTVDAANDINGIALKDPIDGVDDPAVIKALNQWKSGSYLDKGGVYPPLDLVSTRMMHLIVAEHDLANGNTAGFTTHVNHVRAMDGLTPYSGQISANAMMMHARRANTMLMGLRLGDMYRWGIKAPQWLSGSTASTNPQMLPITAIEIRANCHLNGLGCGG